MRFYTNCRKYYCGIESPTSMRHACILNNPGKMLAHRKMLTDSAKFLRLITPDREDLAVEVERIFSGTTPVSPYLLHPYGRFDTGESLCCRSAFTAYSYYYYLGY